MRQRVHHRNQQHSCGRWPLEDQFEGKPEARALFDAFLAAARELGPVEVVSSKTRITLMTRTRFAAIHPRKRHLRGHLVLDRVVKSPRFLRVESISSRNHVHVFELRAADQIDDEMRRLLRAARAVGDQEHLGG